MFTFLGDGAARSFAPDCPYKTPTICVVVLGTVFASVVECRSFGTPTPDNTDIYILAGQKFRLFEELSVNEKLISVVILERARHMCQCFNSFSGFYTSLAYTVLHTFTIAK